MTKLLIADDEKGIRDIVREYGEFMEYEVVEAADGKEAIECVKQGGIDIAVIDIMMPNIDGFTAVKEIKKHAPELPVLFLSARGEEYDKLFGFELGIDDYVVKPFSPKELYARIAAILKRVQGAKSNSGAFKYKGLEIDRAGRTVTVDGHKVDMTPKEYELLFYLLNKSGIAVSREELLSKVWGYEFFGDDRTVDTHVKMLRNSLGVYRDVIVTLRCVGYKFSVD